MGYDLAIVTTPIAVFGLNWLLQSSVLLVLGLAAGRLARGRGPAIQSAVYRTTLAAVLVCPIASAMLGAAGVDGFSLRLPAPAEPASAPPLSQPIVERVEQPASPDADGHVAFIPPSRVEDDSELAAETVTEVESAAPGVEAVASEAVAPSVVRSSPLARAAAIGSTAWGLVSMLLVLRLVVQQARMKRLRAGAAPAGTEAEALCRAVAERMKVAAPTVWRSPFLFSPCLDGLRRPAILLPDDVEDDLHETFIHELAHLARRDGLWNLVRRLAAAALWFQPLLWSLSRRLEATAEEVCDDYVVHFGADRARYAGLLLGFAGRALPPRSPAAVGMISLRSMLARRVVRILDTSRSLSTRAGKKAILATLALGLASTTFAGLLGVGGRPPAVKAGVGDEAQTEPKDSVLHGQVVGPDGKPMAGATVIASRPLPATYGISYAYDRVNRRYEIKRTTTDAEGRYNLDFGDPAAENEVRIVATAPGLGVGYGLKGKPIQLTKGDQPINGRLVDLEGRPAAGVRVRLDAVYAPTPGSPLDTKDPGSLSNRMILDGEPLLPGGVETDADGRFHIEGLGRDVVASLRLSGPTVATKSIRVLTRDMDQIMAKAVDPNIKGLEDPSINGARCTITVEPSRPIEGIVHDIETNEPLANATVTAASLSGSLLVIDGEIATQTDSQGRYRLLGLPKEGTSGHTLAVYPPRDKPYFATRVFKAPASAGIEPVSFDIALRRGIWIEGKVTNLATGKPVSAAIDYFPMLSNARAKDYPNFDSRVSMSVLVKTRFKTDAEGRFRVVGLPGDGVVTAHADEPLFSVGVGAESIKERTEYGQLLTYDRVFPTLYQGLKPVTVPDEAKSFRCDLQLDPGGSVLLHLVDATGAPVTGASVRGRSPESVDHNNQPLFEKTDARIVGLAPGKQREVLIQQRDRKLGALLTITGETKPDAPERTITLRPTAVISGRLVNEKGEPVKGSVQIEKTLAVKGLFSRISIDQVGLDPDGRFRCENVPEGGPYQVSAQGQGGYGFRRAMEADDFQQFDLATLPKVESGATIDLGAFDVTTSKRIKETADAAKPPTADVPITGRIVDLEGRPVAGVVVQVEGVQTPKTGDVSPWIEAIRQGEPPWVANRRVEWETAPSKHKGREETTDTDGRFRLDGLAADRIVHLIVRGDTIACSNLDVITRKMDFIQVQGGGNRYGSGTRNVYGADFTFIAAPTRPYDGVVKDAETGEPVAGVELRSYRFAGSEQPGIMTLRVKSDAQGRFRMTGLPIGAGNILLLVPGDDQPYFLQEIQLPNQSGKDPAPVQVAVTKGIWIEGKLTEKETGKPIAQARLSYLPFLTNTFAQDHPVFKKNGGTDGNFYQDHYLTKPDGSFRIVGLPGRAIVGADVKGEYCKGAGAEAITGISSTGHFATYANPVEASRLGLTTMKEINPQADAKVVHVDLEAFHGDSVQLRVVDGDGRPLDGLTIWGRTERESYLLGETNEPTVKVTGLHPGEERTVMFRHERRKLGKVVRVKKGDDAGGAVAVTLAPLGSLTGRAVDGDGEPIPRATVRPELLPAGDFSLQLAQAFTEANGRFVVSDVPTGCDYRLTIHSRQAASIAVRDNVPVKPGERTDVGDVRFKKPGEQVLQDAKAPPADVPITGRIVDLEGRPVAGVVVKPEDVNIMKGDDLTAWIEGVKGGAPPWVVAQHIDWDRKAPETKGREATTDADGRFRLDGLGAERILELSVQGETIAYTRIHVILRKIAPIPAKGFENHHGPGEQTIYGTDFTYSAAPSRPIEGVVKDSKTGEPLADTGVWSYRFAGSDYVGVTSVKTRTDAQGRFRLTGMPKGKRNTLLIVPNDEQPYFMQELELPDPAGSEPIKADVAIQKGIWIEGKLTEQATGKPIPNAWLHYLPFLSNTFALATPVFDKGGNTDATGYQDRYKSKADGSFRLVGLPGRAIVGAMVYRENREELYMQGAGSDKIAGMNRDSHFETFRNPINPGRLWPTVMKEIDPPADAQIVHVDLQATKGDSVKVRIVAPDGGAVSKVETLGRQSRGSYDAKPVESSDAEVTHLYPGEERTVMFRLKDQKLGKVVRVKKGDDAKGPVVVTLEPLATLTGLVVDPEGVGVSGARVRPDLLPSGNFCARLAEVLTDETGKFIVPDVPIGCDYALAVESPGSIKSRRFAFLKKAVVKPGETTDVGEIRFKKD
jgi:beta-lactamase regulating signal transducer with metallopeptidase domain